ncbi:NAD-P-binding protein [Calocera viscosa TUFC12733]|uniref:NAD-P-binding protein n=1 Tax=Calocera viscosa (strain TUFC12733) TaxID=1330018 RepID=A0A167HRN4_CALVF|nr:NAD-P-binding protein [Calocera viscosa TUFC12733]
MGLFTPSFSASDIPSLQGKIAIVTGATSGIGFQTCLQLALHGAKVYLATRSESKTSSVISQMEEEHPELKGRLVWLMTDLSSVKSCQAAAKEFEGKEERLDLLVNTGAESSTPFALTEEGVSRTFSVNHLGHFALTTGLLPLLERTARLPGSDVRIVTVSSVAHAYAPASTTFESLNEFKATCATGAKGRVDGFRPYMARDWHSKLANVLFAKELQRRLDAQGIPALSMSLSPGSVSTAGSKRAVGLFYYPLSALFFLTPLQGALTSLFAATSPQVLEDRDKYRGAYLVPYGKLAKVSDKAADAAMAGRLWELSEQAMKEINEKGHI